MSNTSTATPSGILFGPNGSGKMYMSLYAHRGSNPRKHQWLSAISPKMEFDIFCIADCSDWRDTTGNYWGIHDQGRTVLGTRSEKLCKFPCTSNSTDPWHGYPVSPSEEGDKDAPPDDFVEKWISTSVVSKVFGRRIQRRKT